MYYRYKTKSGKKKIFGYILILLVFSGTVYTVYHYRQYLYFWKKEHNKIYEKVEGIKQTGDFLEREKRLHKLIEEVRIYMADNSFSPDAYYLAGEVYYLLGECYLGKPFTELIIYGDGIPLNRKSKSEFIKTIKYIRKAKALAGNEYKIHSSLIFARACYYTGYYNNQKIFSVMNSISNFDNFGLDEIRFSALIFILGGKDKEGLDLLNKYGKTSYTVEDRLFLARVYDMAKKYTASIMEYQKVLKKTDNNKILKHVHLNMGKIYFKQSLFRESLHHFSRALDFDEKDNHLKVWVGKSYAALGNKLKARAIWNEVLSTDSTNKEVKDLLGLM